MPEYGVEGLPGDIRDTDGFFLDLTIDKEGAGAYEWEINAGNSPSKKIFRRVDSILETINLTEPDGLRKGVQIRVTTRGTEVSETELDARSKAALILVNREFNTPSAERFNGRMDKKTYEDGRFQGQTIADVIEEIVFQTEGIFRYEGDAPTAFAGSISFRNTPAPSAITQALAVEGNTLWFIDPADGVTLKFVERAPKGPDDEDDSIGVIAQNVVEQSLTGAEEKSGLPVLVTDKDRRGLKTQYGGLSWVGRDAPKPLAIGAALKPLDLEADLSDLDRAAKEAAAGTKSINGQYLYTSHLENGTAGWHAPKDASGNILKATLRLVQKGVMRADLVTRKTVAEPGFVQAKPYQTDLLLHPNLKLSFEAKVSGPPQFFPSGGERVPVHQAPVARARFKSLASEANGLGRTTKELSSKPGRRGTFVFSESPEFTDPDTGDKFVKMAVVGLWTPQWGFVNGFVDLDRGELVVESDQPGAFTGLVSAFNVGAGQSTELGWSFDPAQGGSASNPVPLIKVNFVEGVKEAKFRAHVVTAEELGPFTSPVAPGGAILPPPYAAVESGDFEKHNVIFNAAEVQGFLVPRKKPRDDSALMKTRAGNLAKTLTLPAMAKGAITIYPGDLSLTIGQPANGGVIVKIKHLFVPFFKTTFWLEGTPDVDNPEAKHWRKKIGEHEGLTQVNSASIAQQARTTDSLGGGGGTGKLPVHDHGDDQSGGAELGDIQVSTLAVQRQAPDGQAGLALTRHGATAPLDAKWVSGLGRMVSGDMLLEVTEIVGDKVKGRVYADPKAPVISDVAVLLNGVLASAAQVGANVTVGDKRPLMFVESADPTVRPTAAIFVDDALLVVDHFRDDEVSTNQSTVVLAAPEVGDPVLSDAGDLDDLFIVEPRATTSVPGDTTTVVAKPRLQLYMNEQDSPIADPREGFVTGPHGKSTKRSEHRSGLLSDVFRYWQSLRNADTLAIRDNARFSGRFKEALAEDDEGSLDFASLHPDGEIKVSAGIKGAPLVFDHLSWKDAATGVEERGLRWKVAPICDHKNPQHQGVPTTTCKNQSTNIWESDFSDKGDLDDVLIVKDGLLRLFMLNYDPCGSTTVSSTCDPETRFGLISDGSAKALMADVFEYHSPAGVTSLDIKTSAHFKKSIITGAAVLDGPLFFVEEAILQPAPFIGTDLLYGRLALDKTRAVCGGLGSWVIEIPYQACNLDSNKAAFDSLRTGTEIAVTHTDTTAAAILALVKANRDLTKSVFAIQRALDLQIDAASETRDLQIVASVNAALAQMAADITQCTCCNITAPVVEVTVGGLTVTDPTLPGDPTLEVVPPTIPIPCPD